MRRRQMMAGMAAGLAAPSVVGAQGAQILRFVPSVDLTVTDPIYGTSFTTRNHVAMVFDTLYGVDEQMRAHPQMAAGHVVENDGLTWRITLRDGLRFHDGEPVLARDCIASLQRWGRRDTFGSTLFATTNEVVAESDKVIVWRLKRPFRMLPDALGDMIKIGRRGSLSGWRRPIPTSRRQRSSAAAPIASWPPNTTSAIAPPMRSSTATCPAPTARPAPSPARRWRISTAWNG